LYEALLSDVIVVAAAVAEAQEQALALERGRERLARLLPQVPPVVVLSWLLVAARLVRAPAAPVAGLLFPDKAEPVALRGIPR